MKNEGAIYGVYKTIYANLSLSKGSNSGRHRLMWVVLEPVWGSAHLRFLIRYFSNANIMMIVPLEHDLVNISQLWWVFWGFFFGKSKIAFFKILSNLKISSFMYDIRLEHYTEKREREKSIWNSVLVKKRCYQYL